MPNGWISKHTRQAIYDRDNCTCCYCGKLCVTGIANQSELTRSEKHAIATLDHIVSQKELAESSANDKEFYAKRRDPKNLVVACQGCNSSKQHTSLYAWCAISGKDYVQISAEIMRRVSISVE